jgi:hypothetical protein
MATGAGKARTPELPHYPQPDTSQLEEQIRLRAHEIWPEGDGRGGSAPEDGL